MATAVDTTTTTPDAHVELCLIDQIMTELKTAIESDDDAKDDQLCTLVAMLGRLVADAGGDEEAEAVKARALTVSYLKNYRESGAHSFLQSTSDVRDIMDKESVDPAEARRQFRAYTAANLAADGLGPATLYHYARQNDANLTALRATLPTKYMDVLLGHLHARYALSLTLPPLSFRAASDALESDAGCPTDFKLTYHEADFIRARHLLNLYRDVLEQARLLVQSTTFERTKRGADDGPALKRVKQV